MKEKKKKKTFKHVKITQIGQLCNILITNFIMLIIRVLSLRIFSDEKWDKE